MRAKAPFRLTAATLDVLAVLSDGYEKYGYELARLVERPTGSVNLILTRLEHHGWAKSEWDASDRNGPRRRFFWIVPWHLEDVQQLLSERRPPTALLAGTTLLVSYPHSPQN